jgi:cell wall-associated NlpC family hydrolase
VDQQYENHFERTPYHYALNTPLNLLDDSGLDSAQRQIMVEAALAYINSGPTYKLGAKGPPGEPTDCSGLVDYCMTQAGEESTLARKDLGGGTGVQRIEAAGEEVKISKAEPGNVVTFRTGGNWGFHTGLITKVNMDKEGKVQSIEFVHSNSKANGASKSTLSPDGTNFWSRFLHGIYKVDTKPEKGGDKSANTGDGKKTPILKERQD